MAVLEQPETRIPLWEIPPPPEDLKAAGVTFWEPTASQKQLSPDELWTLHQCCASLDAWTDAREILAAEGSVLTDRWGQRKAHPAVKIARDAEIAYREGLRLLGLKDIPPRKKRPRWVDDDENGEQPGRLTSKDRLQGVSK